MKLPWKETIVPIVVCSTLVLTAWGTFVLGANNQETKASASVQHSTSAMSHNESSNKIKSDQASSKKSAVLPAFTGAEKTKELPDGQRLMNYTLKDGVKEFNIVAQPTEWYTKKGEKHEAWTYNGTMPGPQIRVTEGDKVRIKFTNKLPEDTVFHLHGVHVPNNMDGVAGVTQEPIKPNQTFVYEFTAKNPGTHMFHSHLNTMHQVDMVLFGNIIIEPKQKLEVDKEFTMMLSDGSMGYLINGKSFPDTHPFNVKIGDKVRIRLSNVGNQAHPFHLHGHSFTIVAKDGNEIPKSAQYQADTVDMLPGDRYDIEFVAQEKGTWLFHCHVLTHVHGANGEDTGMIQVINIK